MHKNRPTINGHIARGDMKKSIQIQNPNLLKAEGPKWSLTLP